MAILIIDSVAREEGTPIGACIANYLKVVGASPKLFEIGDVDGLIDALASIRKEDSGSAILLIAHANKDSFKVPGGKTPFRWGKFAGLIEKYVSKVQLLFLCGCETGGQETMSAILSASPTVRAVYGTLDKIGFPEATYGFLSLFYHVHARKHGIKEALELATRHTGVGFVAALR